MNMHAVSITAREHAELVANLPPPGDPGPEEIRGRTLWTLISPGTELAACYQGSRFPSYPGYAAVFEVQAVGTGVKQFRPGDIAFCMGSHRSVQQVSETMAVAVPKGLEPATAVLARLMGVSMTTLMTTAARAGDRVLVTGAGPVGFLAAHIFACGGYDVLVVEPDTRRHAALARSGRFQVFTQIPLDDPKIVGNVALAVECSGHEQAVLDACNVVRPRGEVVLVGVPWQRRTDRTAHELLHAVFHRYIVLRSGWEWELPQVTSKFQPHSIMNNFALALQWLNEGLVNTEGLVRHCDPRDPQPVYQDLLHHRTDALFCLFDWGRLAGNGEGVA